MTVISKALCCIALSAAVSSFSSLPAAAQATQLQVHTEDGVQRLALNDIDGAQKP